MNQSITHLSKNHLIASMYAAKYGWYISTAKGKIPTTPNGHLDATNDQDTLRALFSRDSKANLLVSVRPSRLCILDLDSKPNQGIDASETLVEIEAKYGAMETPCVHTPGGGYHFYFETDLPLPRRIGVSTGVDILGDGFAILPPSKSEDGKFYEWDEILHINTTPIAKVPDWLANLAIESKSVTSAYSNDHWSDMFKGIPEGQRNAALVQILGHLFRRFVSPTLAHGAIHAINKTHCNPPLPEHEIEQAFQSIANLEFKRREKRGA